MANAARVGGSTPSYLHGLATLGQYIHQQHGSRITIAEIDSGFLVLFFENGRWTKPKATAIHHTELLELSGTLKGSTAGKPGLLLKGGDQHDRKHPLCPMGYDAFFRALGLRFDRKEAIGITICETPERFYVGYWKDRASFVVHEGRRQSVSPGQMETYDAAGVKALLASTARYLSEQMGRHKQGLDINANDHLSMMEAAFMLEDDGEYRQAEALLRRVASTVPKHPEAHYQVARLALMRGDRGSALASVKKALRNRADDAAAQDLYGRMLRQDGKLAEATVAFEHAVACDRTNTIHHYHLAKAYEAAGRLDEAAVEMAASTSQTAAPSWDMVQEEISIEVQVSGPLRLAEAARAHPALLPRIAEEVPTVALSAPTLTTSFEPPGYALTPVPASGTRNDTLQPLERSSPIASAPVGTQAAASAGAASDLLRSLQAPKPTTLEERLLNVNAQDAQLGEPRTAIEQPAPVQATAPAVSVVLPVQPQPMMHPQAWSAAGAMGTPQVTPDSAAQGSTLPDRPAAQAADAGAGSVELAAEVLVIQRALEIEPMRADLHRKLGLLLARQGKTAEAATEFRKGLQASRASL